MDTDSPVHEIMTEDFFSEILQKMQRQDLIQADIQWMIADHYQQEKNEKFIGIMKDELNGKIMAVLVALRTKRRLPLLM